MTNVSSSFFLLFPVSSSLFFKFNLTLIALALFILFWRSDGITKRKVVIRFTKVYFVQKFARHILVQNRLYFQMTRMTPVLIRPYLSDIIATDFWDITTTYLLDITATFRR